MTKPSSDLAASPIVYGKNDSDSLLSPIVVCRRYVSGIPWHSHTKAQLLYSKDKVMTVFTEEGMWVTPPQLAIWVSSKVPHKTQCASVFTLLALYCAPELSPRQESCCVVTVDPLMRELLGAAAEIGDGYEPDGPDARLMTVLLDRLRILPSAPLSLAYPKDERAQSLARLMVTELGNHDSVASLTARCGMSTRTACRVFIEETGMAPATWRRQFRLLEAMRRLGEGESVTSVALETGYKDVSSFIAAFKKSTGQTPARFFHNLS